MITMDDKTEELIRSFSRKVLNEVGVCAYLGKSLEESDDWRVVITLGEANAIIDQLTQLYQMANSVMDLAGIED